MTATFKQKYQKMYGTAFKKLFKTYLIQELTTEAKLRTQSNVYTKVSFKKLILSNKKRKVCPVQVTKAIIL